MIITLVDETGVGRAIHTQELVVEQESLTVRDLIALRVAAEVERHNHKQTFVEHSLVQLADARELQLNGKAKGYRKLTREDAEKQTYLAWDGFVKNRFFVLVNDLQATSLDETLQLNPSSKIAFLRLTPLVGG